MAFVFNFFNIQLRGRFVAVISKRQRGAGLLRKPGSTRRSRRGGRSSKIIKKTKIIKKLKLKK